MFSSASPASSTRLTSSRLFHWMKEFLIQTSAVDPSSTRLINVHSLRGTALGNFFPFDKAIVFHTYIGWTIAFLSAMYVIHLTFIASSSHVGGSDPSDSWPEEKFISRLCSSTTDRKSTRLNSSH